MSELRECVDNNTEDDVQTYCDDYYEGDIKECLVEIIYKWLTSWIWELEIRIKLEKTLNKK